MCKKREEYHALLTGTYFVSCNVYHQIQVGYNSSPVSVSCGLEDPFERAHLEGRCVFVEGRFGALSPRSDPNVLNNLTKQLYCSGPFGYPNRTANRPPNFDVHPLRASIGPVGVCPGGSSSRQGSLQKVSGEAPTLAGVVRELAATVFILGGAWHLLWGCSMCTVYGFQHTFFSGPFLCSFRLACCQDEESDERRRKAKAAAASRPQPTEEGGGLGVGEKTSSGESSGEAAKGAGAALGGGEGGAMAGDPGAGDKEDGSEEDGGVDQNPEIRTLRRRAKRYQEMAAKFESKVLLEWCGCTGSFTLHGMGWTNIRVTAD